MPSTDPPANAPAGQSTPKLAPVAAHDVLDPLMVAILRPKTPAEMIAGARRTALRLAAAGVRHRRSDLNAEQVRAEAIRRISSGAR